MMRVPLTALSLLPMLLCAAPAGAQEFQSGWHLRHDRVWIGPEYYANRLLDWRIADGRLECVEGRSQKPMRTVHLLVRDLGAEPGDLRMSAHTGSVEPSEERSPDTWTGFLIGVGGDHVDFRTSALCHHWPGEDGGLICAVDGTGRAVFRDNSSLAGPRGARGDIPTEAWPLLEPDSRKGPGFGPGQAPELWIELEAEPDGEGYALVLSAHAFDGGRLLHRATLRGVDPEQLSGNVALVSHGSPSGRSPGYWFRDWRVAGSKTRDTHARAFGPVMAVQHTQSGGVLKMTAQMGPLGERDERTAELRIVEESDQDLRTVATGTLAEHSYTIPFRVEGWDPSREALYHIAYEEQLIDGSTQPYDYWGVIPADPAEKDELVVAAFTGHHISAKGQGHWNGDHIWYPHAELVEAVRHHQPDLLFFSGDQIYEGGLAGIVRNPPETACLDYLYHWYRWCWAFGELSRFTPCVCIPDDHDVYHGNIWGAGGRKAIAAEGRSAQDSGGYRMDPLFVNAVHRTQTSHLPDPADPRPIDQDISVYFARMEYGGLSFAILADRMFKSAPSVAVPEGKVVNGWFQNRDFDPVTGADVPGAVLLGERQLDFLSRWAVDFSGGAWMKVVLSQTIFANVATLPVEAAGDGVVPGLRYADPGEYLEGDVFAADADSNGWPRTGRDRALAAMRRGFAFHIAGDQHLGSFVHYGVEEHNDAAFALCVPSIANVWPRRWFPPEPGRNRPQGAPRYAGEFRDGFGNRVTVHAVSNPVRSGRHPEALHDRAPGYGIVRFRRATREIEAECWPRWSDPSGPDAEQYAGWPVTVSQRDNFGRAAAAWLPEISVSGVSDPVVQVIDERDGEILYALRIAGRTFRPWVFREGTYSLRVGEPGTDRWRTVEGLRAAETAEGSIEIGF